jgi:hypothetical protein
MAQALLDHRSHAPIIVRTRSQIRKEETYSDEKFRRSRHVDKISISPKEQMPLRIGGVIIGCKFRDPVTLALDQLKNQIIILATERFNSLGSR